MPTIFALLFIPILPNSLFWAWYYWDKRLLLHHEEQLRLVCPRVWHSCFVWGPRPGDGVFFLRLMFFVSWGYCQPLRWALSLSNNTPFRRPSCQAREEKRKFSPTAHSSAAAPPLSTQSHVSCCAAHACRGERKWRPKVYPARQVVHSFSRCLSLLMTAAIVPTVPPLSCSAPLPWSVCLSLSLSLWAGCMLSKMWLCSMYIICYQFKASNGGTLGYRPVLCGFSLWLVGFPVFRLGDWFT